LSPLLGIDIEMGRCGQYCHIMAKPLIQ
jgi:hypothetical protein